jgi:hypothetical protein
MPWSAALRLNPTPGPCFVAAKSYLAAQYQRLRGRRRRCSLSEDDHEANDHLMRAPIMVTVSAKAEALQATLHN